MADGDGLVWASDANIKIDGDSDMDLFGNAVSTAGVFFDNSTATDAVIVGAPGVNDMKGAFYVFDMDGISSSTTAANADYAATASTVGTLLGLSVTDLTDIDNDNDSDVAAVGQEILLIHDEN